MKGHLSTILCQNTRCPAFLALCLVHDHFRMLVDYAYCVLFKSHCRISVSRHEEIEILFTATQASFLLFTGASERASKAVCFEKNYLKILKSSRVMFLTFATLKTEAKNKIKNTVVKLKFIEPTNVLCLCFY